MDIQPSDICAPQPQRAQRAPDKKVAECRAAVPTSATLARQARVISTFLDLRSRCITLLACRCASPAVMSSATWRPCRRQLSSEPRSPESAARRSPPCRGWEAGFQ